MTGLALPDSISVQSMRPLALVLDAGAEAVGQGVLACMADRTHGDERAPRPPWSARSRAHGWCRPGRGRTRARCRARCTPPAAPRCARPDPSRSSSGAPRPCRLASRCTVAFDTSRNPLPSPEFFRPRPSPTALPAARARRSAAGPRRAARAPRHPSSMICRPDRPGTMTLRLRISQPLMPTSAARRSITPSMANCAWLPPKPRNAPQHGVVGAHRGGDHVDGGGGTGHWRGRQHVQHLAADRTRGAAVVADDPRLHAVSLPSASHPAVYSMRIGWRFVCIRSDSSRLTVHLTGFCRSHAGERGVRLVGHVLLAAERPAVRHQLDGDPVPVDCRARTRSGCGRPTRLGRRSTTCMVPWAAAGRAWPPVPGTPARCAASGRRRARRARRRRARRRRHPGVLQHRQHVRATTRSAIVDGGADP